MNLVTAHFAGAADATIVIPGFNHPQRKKEFGVRFCRSNGGLGFHGTGLRGAEGHNGHDGRQRGNDRARKVTNVIGTNHFSIGIPTGQCVQTLEEI
jgi:hypothetical protein